MDPIDTISRVTGLSRPVMDQIWEQVKANHKLLNTCAGHDFSVEHEKRCTLTTKWKCARCGGVISHSDKHWYELGLKHGQSPRTPC